MYYVVCMQQIMEFYARVRKAHSMHSWILFCLGMYFFSTFLLFRFHWYLIEYWWLNAACVCWLCFSFFAVPCLNIVCIRYMRSVRCCVHLSNVFRHLMIMKLCAIIQKISILCQSIMEYTLIHTKSIRDMESVHRNRTISQRNKQFALYVLYFIRISSLKSIEFNVKAAIIPLNNSFSLIPTEREICKAIYWSLVQWLKAVSNLVFKIGISISTEEKSSPFGKSACYWFSFGI